MCHLSHTWLFSWFFHRLPPALYKPQVSSAAGVWALREGRSHPSCLSCMSLSSLVSGSHAPSLAMLCPTGSLFHDLPGIVLSFATVHSSVLCFSVSHSVDSGRKDHSSKWGWWNAFVGVTCKKVFSLECSHFLLRLLSSIPVGTYNSSTEFYNTLFTEYDKTSGRDLGFLSI